MSYKREDDNETMIEIAPHSYISSKVAKALGMITAGANDDGMAVREEVDVRTSPPRERAAEGGDQTVERGGKKTPPRARKPKPVSKGRAVPGAQRKRVLTPRQK